MLYKRERQKQTSITRNESVEGETLETKVFRALTSEEGIEESANIIYTERKDGVMPEYDPRADKFEVALDATSKIDADNKVRRLEGIKSREPKADQGGEGGEGKA